MKKAPAPPAAEVQAEIEAMKAIADELEKDSRVTNAAARRALAEAAAVTQLQIRSVHARRAAGQLAAEEARTVPGLISNLKRLLEELGHGVGGVPAAPKGFAAPMIPKKPSAPAASKRRE